MKKLIQMLLLGAAILPVLKIAAQVPQIPLTGSVGAGGNFPAICTTTVTFPSDANYTPAYPGMACSSGVMVVTSTGSLTATRNLVLPIAQGFNWRVHNLTSGGQSIQVIGPTGAGVTIANGTVADVSSNGTNYLGVTGGGGGSGGSPGGANGTIQFNQSGVFAAVPGYTLDPGLVYGLSTAPTYLLPGYNDGVGSTRSSYSTTVLSGNPGWYGQGLKSLFNETLNINGNGDINVLDLNTFTSGGINGLNDEGLSGIRNQISQDGNPVWSGTYASSSYSAGETYLHMSAFNGTGNIGVPRFLIDTTTGTLTQTATAVSASTHYATVTFSGATFPVSINGTLAAAVSVSTGTSFPATLVQIQATVGSACTTGNMVSIYNGYPESAIIQASPAPTYSAGVYTFYAYLRYNHASGEGFSCGGMAGRYLSQTGDTLNGQTLLFRVFGSPSATQLYVGRDVEASTDAGFIHGYGSDIIYQGAPVVDARNSSGTVDALNFYIGDTTAPFTVGDTLVNPAWITQDGQGYLDHYFSNNPYVSWPHFKFVIDSGSTAGGSQAPGLGVAGGGAYFTITNHNPNTNYTNGGGQWVPDPFLSVSGPMGQLVYYSTAPTTQLIEFQNTAGSTIGMWQADDANFYQQIGQNSGMTNTFVTTHADTFTYGGSHAGNTAFNINGSLNLNNSTSPLLLNGNAGTSGQCPISGGAGATPNWGSCGSGTGTVTDGAGTTTPGTIPESTTTAHVLDYNSNLLIAAGVLTYSGPGGFSITGTTHGITIPAGTAVSGVAGKVVLSSDATNGYLEANENNTGAARVCTATNGVCGSGVADATTTVGTTAIAANSCSSATTVTMTGLTTSMTAQFTPTSDVSTVTGWNPVTPGLYISAWPSAANTLSYRVCNTSSSSITPGASVTFNISAR